MSRYLTAPKICLLTLISLYAESVIPTEAIIPILYFIVSALSKSTSSVAGVDSLGVGSTSAAPIDEIRKATITHASGIPGRTLWDLVLKRLWKLDSFDALHAFFNSFSLLVVTKTEELEQDADSSDVLDLERMRFSKTSPFGVFIRRTQLEFERLQLHDGIALWESFVCYREPTLLTWAKRNSVAGKASFDVNIAIGHSERNTDLRAVIYRGLDYRDSETMNVSTEDVETLLEFERDRMQTAGIRISSSMKSKLEEFAQTGITIPSLSHYVKFLDAWKCGDYPSSFDNLHRYFDYTMHNCDRTFYQYALLNLAILQKDFGCLPEAVAAMYETISTARENKDMACLNWSLSWLYHLGKAHPAEAGDIQKSGVLGTDREALAFMKAKAKEATMWSLLSTTLLSEARLNLVNVGCPLASMATSSGVFRLNRYRLALRGRYDQAILILEDVDQASLRTIKHQQYWMTCLRLLKLQRSLRRDHLNAAEHFLSQIQAVPLPDHEASFPTVILGVELQIRRQNFSKAIQLLDIYAEKIHMEGADLLLRIKLMILKARTYDKAGQSQKGFSIAIRAASLAHRARLLPALWESVGVLCRVLISLGEFDAALRLLKGIMPQVLEAGDCELAAVLFSYLADAQMGIAGRMVAGSIKQKKHMATASGYLERSFDEYSRIEDVKGQCEMLAKKATILQLNEDLVLANDCAARYLATLQNVEEALVL